MCEPTTISTLAIYAMGISAAVSAAGTALSVKQANDQARVEAEAANQAASADYAALEAAAQEESDVYRAEALKAQLEAKREEAAIRVAQGESGLLGATSMREIAAARLRESTELSTLETNLANKAAQGGREIGRVTSVAKARSSSARAKMTGAAAAGLQILGSGAGGAVRGKTFYDSLTAGYKEGR